VADDAVYNAATRELTATVPKAHGFAVGDIVCTYHGGRRQRG
jgi:hypothetical protein